MKTNAPTVVDLGEPSICVKNGWETSKRVRASLGVRDLTVGVGERHLWLGMKKSKYTIGAYLVVTNGPSLSQEGDRNSINYK